MNKITNPSNLSPATVSVDTNARRLTLQYGGTGSGEVGAPGVTLQCLYSYLKMLWRSDVTYRMFPFPMTPITSEQFELIDGWDFGDVLTRRLIRDGGWVLRGVDGSIQEMYCNITTLGQIDNPNSDTIYYQQAPTGAATWSPFSGPVNLAVKIYGDSTHGGFSYRNYLKLFLRVQGKVYDYYDLPKSQNIPLLEYRKYVVPLSNSLDFKISTPDSIVASRQPYTGMTVLFLDGVVLGQWQSGVAYVIGNVVQHSGRWFRCISPVTGATAPEVDATHWERYIGERQVGGNWYAFTTIINANGGSAEEIYERMQYLLRQSTPVDVGSTVMGNTATSLVYFTGQTLYTELGVFVDNFAPSDLNRIVFKDWSDSSVAYPFTASLMLVFNDNLINDYRQSATPPKYRVYYTSVPSGNFGTSAAVIVKDSQGNDMIGSIDASIASRGFVSYTYDYDANRQGGRMGGVDADITVVAVGTRVAQYVMQQGTITRSTTNIVQLVSQSERNY